MTHEDLFKFFYKTSTLKRKNKGWEINYNKDDFVGMKLDFDLIDSETGKVYAKAGEKFNIVVQKKLAENSVKNLFLNDFDNYLKKVHEGKKLIKENFGYSKYFGRSRNHC